MNLITFPHAEHLGYTQIARNEKYLLFENKKKLSLWFCTEGNEDKRYTKVCDLVGATISHPMTEFDYERNQPVMKSKRLRWVVRHPLNVGFYVIKECRDGRDIITIDGVKKVFNNVLDAVVYGINNLITEKEVS